jgi:TPR repeat protein
MDQNTLQKLEIAAVKSEEAGNYHEAFGLFSQLAEAGNGYAMSALARFYEDGMGVDPDFEMSLVWAERAITAGNFIAIYNLAVTYRRIGNLRKSKALFEEVLALGELSAALDLAKMFLISDKETETVRKYLRMVLEGRPMIDVTEGNIAEAEALMRELVGRI